MNTIDLYIQNFPESTKIRLAQIRSIIHDLAPEAKETIKYSMPTFIFNGQNLIHFAGYKNHVGLYPLPEAIKIFKNELVPYPTGKGSIRFPNDQALPLNLIEKIVKYRISSIINPTT